jgi:hypothetical protein
MLLAMLMFFQLGAGVDAPSQPSAPILVSQESSSKASEAKPAVQMAVARFDPTELSLPLALEPSPIQPVVKPTEPRKQHPWTDKRWTALTVAQHSAATFDAWTTRRVVSSGRGHETNPLLRSAANSDALYAAIQVTPVVCDFVGSRMQRSSNHWVRRLWWTPQAFGTGMHLWSGFHNIGVYNSVTPRVTGTVR